MNHRRIATAVANWVVRPAGMAQVALGLLFWTGHAASLVPLHMRVGMVFVLSLWALAALAAGTRATRALAAVVALWTALVLALGVTQGRLLPGPMHWLVELLHFLVGVAAMALASRLAGRLRAVEHGAPAAPATSQAA